jgi:hypothetical protein
MTEAKFSFRNTVTALFYDLEEKVQKNNFTPHTLCQEIFQHGEYLKKYRL